MRKVHSNPQFAIHNPKFSLSFMRIAILISGRGSNMLALAEAISSGAVTNAQIEIVISDQPAAAGLELAKNRGLKAVAVPRGARNREEHEREIIATFQEHKIDLICLAGYMRVLSDRFVETFAGRILNIHPSLLPSFPGLHPQRQALEHGVKWTGCTVHIVDNTLDGGPIVAQRVMQLFDDDTEDSLSERLLHEEHKLYPEAVALIAGGHYEIVGRRVLRKNQS
jgi:phosphoribosylglycinamide formyltransferase-1